MRDWSCKIALGILELDTWVVLLIFILVVIYNC